MSISTILNTATSGMTTAQAQLRVTSDNIANINTPGYVRKIADQVSRVTDGIGSGVEIARVRLATDRFLQAASLTAKADAERAGVRSDLYDRLQSLFGDPGEKTGFFSQIDQVFGAFSALAEDPTSSPRRQEAVFLAETIFTESARISKSLQDIRSDADGRIVSAVDRVNGLLKDIEALNVDITRAVVAGREASGAEAAQSKLLSELSGIMDIRITGRQPAGVTVRTGDGMLLAGEGHATLSYQRAGDINAESAFDEIWLTQPRGEKRSLEDHLDSGELRGLLDLRDTEAVQAAERLAELTAHVADELNRAHNASSAAPPPNSLTGRKIGIDVGPAAAGFTGVATVNVVDNAGVVQRNLRIDFDANQIIVDGGPPAAFADAGFATALNAALGGFGTANFAGGALNITAANPAHGVAVAGGPGTEATNNGRGFSHYFGLNDLVRSNRMTTYDTGLTGGTTHQFTAGQTISFRFSDPNGARIRDVTATIAAGDMNSLVTSLNSQLAGYGAFTLDGQGRMTFSPSGSPPMSMEIKQDTTGWGGVGGVRMSELFGIGSGVRASRADGFTIRPDVLASPMKLSLAWLDVNATVGQSALTKGDGRGALALADAGERATSFDAAGGTGAVSTSVSRYAADLSGDIGQKAAAHEARKESAEAIAAEAENRRSSVEGVNLDEELVKLTTFQQSFNASARMIQAAKELYDVLLSIL